MSNRSLKRSDQSRTSISCYRHISLSHNGCYDKKIPRTILKEGTRKPIDAFESRCKYCRKTSYYLRDRLSSEERLFEKPRMTVNFNTSILCTNFRNRRCNLHSPQFTWNSCHTLCIGVTLELHNS